jgi:hypothetical protein
MAAATIEPWAGLQQALEPYRRLDPSGWVNLHEALPAWAGVVAVIVAVLLLLFGSGHPFRLVAGTIAAVVGVVWVPLIATRLGLAPQVTKISLGAAGVLFVLATAWPPTALFAAVGLPVGIVFGEAAGVEHWPMGFVPGFLLSGALAAGFHRHVASLVSSVIGAWLLVLGLLVLLRTIGVPVDVFAKYPWGAIAAALLFAVAGMVYQLAARPSPEEARQLQAEREAAKKRREEERATRERWAKRGWRD